MGQPRYTPVPWTLIAVGCLAALPYVPTLANGFVWDDLISIQDNPNIQQLGALTRYALQQEGIYYRPAVFSSFALDYALWRQTPFGYHLTNLALHVLNSVLLVSVAVRTGIPHAGAALGGAIFALHPVQSEAVAYVSGRTDLLMTASALLAWRAILAAGFAARRGFAAALATAVAILSKESGYALAPFLAWVACRHHRETARRLALAGPSVAVALVLFVARPQGFHEIARAGSLHIDPVGIGRALATYLGLLVWPAHLHIDRLTRTEGPSIENTAAAMLLLAALGACAYGLSRRDTRSDWTAWTLAFYLPVANIIAIYPAIAERALFTPEHNLYAPLAGLSALIGFAAAREVVRVTMPLKALLVTIIALVLVAWGVRTCVRTFDWHDEERLYRTAVTAGMASPRVWYNYGNTLMRRDASADAVAAYREGLRQAPHDADLWTNLGVALQQQGQLDAAIAAYEHAVALGSPSAVVLENLGSVQVRAGNLPAARDAFAQALAIDPSRATARAALRALDALQQQRRE